MERFLQTHAPHIGRTLRDGCLPAEIAELKQLTPHTQAKARELSSPGLKPLVGHCDSGCLFFMSHGFVLSFRSMSAYIIQMCYVVKFCHRHQEDAFVNDVPQVHENCWQARWCMTDSIWTKTTVTQTQIDRHTWTYIYMPEEGWAYNETLASACRVRTCVP